LNAKKLTERLQRAEKRIAREKWKNKISERFGLLSGG
jgi:hypothetical protein